MNTEPYNDGHDKEYNENSGNWILLGKINDPTTAEYAKETLKSYNIPVVVFSESGFFGQAGLNLPSFHNRNLGQFRIHVMRDDKEEAVEILNMILGDNWEKAD